MIDINLLAMQFPMDDMNIPELKLRREKEAPVAEMLNPFVHKVELETPLEKIKTGVLTVILLPFRVIVICCLIVTAWFLACIGLFGLSEEDLREKPMYGWRRLLRHVILALMKLVIIAASFHRIKYSGLKNLPKNSREAPIIVMAPHSSFFDAIAIVCLGGPSVVAKADTAKIPFIKLYLLRLRRAAGSAAAPDFLWVDVTCDGHRVSTHVASLLINNISTTKRVLGKMMWSLKPLICVLGKLSYLAGGMAITVRGKQATREEAPILIIAPHSSFLDSCIVYVTKMSSVIVRKESMDNYVGKLINYTQPVYVWRDDPNSRQNTIKEIIERATSKEDWPQVLIFPEGTCTNRSCLITFKPGGFYPGVPVQPVTIRYPNALDTVTWTWEGPGALKLLWLTLTQLHSSCEIEFLPVYHPNEQEKNDPKLYARNVRDVMAGALGIPTMDCTYDDCKLIERAKALGIPNANKLNIIIDLRKRLGLHKSKIELRLVKTNSVNGNFTLNYKKFCERLEIEPHPLAKQLFDIFCTTFVTEVNWLDYIFVAVFITVQNVTLAELAKYAFKIYDTSCGGYVEEYDFNQVAHKCLGLHREDSSEMYKQSKKEHKRFITYESFIEFIKSKPEYSYFFTTDYINEKRLKSQ